MNKILLTVLAVTSLVFAFVPHWAQAQSPDDFVTTWRVGAGDLSITIPTTGGGYNYTVVWGDGSADSTDQIGDATHTYMTPNDYEVRISGDFPRIFFNNAGDREKIISIDRWGTQIWTSMNNAFSGATNLAGLASDRPDLSSVTDMSFMFAGATAFNQDIGNWRVARVTNMSSMFAGASAFDGDIGGWNVYRVTNMSNMFREATAFDGDISGWNVGRVTNMSNMFRQATAFNQDIGGWNIRRVRNMSSMFANATAFDGDISGWNVGRVTNMSNMFAGVTLSTANYDALLRGWSSLPSLQRNVAFDGGNAEYCAVAAHDVLTTPPNSWGITDGGLASCSSVTTLSALSLSGATLSPDFASDTRAYTATVATDIDTVMITPTTTDPAAAITVDDTPATSGDPSGAISLIIGENPITVVVTNGAISQTYTVTVTRADNTAPDFAPGETITAQTYTAGTAITALTLPEAMGGNGDLTHVLTGTLPNGLMFNAGTRTLSGTPSTPGAAVTLTWTATDADTNIDPSDSATLDFTITVNAADTAPDFGTNTIVNQTYTVDVAITDLILPEASGGNGDLTHVLTGTLPNGLMFNAGTRTLSGTPETPAAETTL